SVKFSLRNVSMREILDAIVTVADSPIGYSVEDYAVVFSPKYGVMPPAPRETGPQVSLRTFRVDTNTFIAGLESAFGIRVELSKDDKTAARSRKIQSALKDLMTQLGIAMDGNKTVFYNELTGIVMVRVAPHDQDTVRAAMETL